MLSNTIDSISGIKNAIPLTPNYKFGAVSFTPFDTPSPSQPEKHREKQIWLLHQDYSGIPYLKSGILQCAKFPW